MSCKLIFWNTTGCFMVFKFAGWLIFIQQKCWIWSLILPYMYVFLLLFFWCQWFKNVFYCNWGADVFIKLSPEAEILYCRTMTTTMNRKQVPHGPVNLWLCELRDWKCLNLVIHGRVKMNVLWFNTGEQASFCCLRTWVTEFLWCKLWQASEQAKIKRNTLPSY